MDNTGIYSEKIVSKKGNKVIDFIRAQNSATIGFIILFLIMSVSSDAFLNPRNLVNIARQISINMIVSVGMTLVIITGGIDLSVGAVMALTGTTMAALVANYNIPIPIAIVIVLAVTVLLGVLKGHIISSQNLPPFIVTLAMLTIISGISFLMTGGRPISVNTDAYKLLGRGYIGPVPIPVLIMVLVIYLGIYILNKTDFGRHIYAVGGNPEASRLCGINNHKVIMKVYALAGLFTGISGIILSSRLASGSPTVGVGSDLDAIASVILGGTSFSGGVGTIKGTIFGALIMGVLSNGMNLLNVSSYNQMIVKGMVILLAIWVNNSKSK